MNSFLTRDLLLKALSPEEISKSRFQSSASAIYQTENAVWFESATAKGIIVVPRGFITDFATIPDLAQGLFLMHDNPIIMKPSVIHDMLYSVKGRLDVIANGRQMYMLLTRQQCDYILCYEAMTTMGATKEQSDLVYTALRLLGDSWGEGYQFRERFNF